MEDILELHISGPGFNLPAIDAQCLAAIAYLRLALPRKSPRGVGDDLDDREDEGDEKNLKGKGRWVLKIAGCARLEPTGAKYS